VARGVNSCTDTAKGVVKVLPYPVSRFTGSVYGGCSPLSVLFSNQSVNTQQVVWNFGDGQTSKLANPVHTFINPTDRDTQFRVTLFSYFHDCIDTLSSWVKVASRPFAFFKADRSDDCDRGLYVFKNLSLGAKTSIWNFGDGQFSADTQPQHWFATSGYRDTAYKVQLVATNRQGCSDTFDRRVVLPQRLQVALKDTNYLLCSPGTVKFINYSSGAKLYFWNFGDNLSSVDRNPYHTYTKPGKYRYSLYAYDANGCLDSAKSEGIIWVLESPEARFTYAPQELRMPNNNVVQFTDQSISSVPLNYNWDFGDLNTIVANSSKQNPLFMYSDSGNFRVRLIVDNGSCADTAIQLLRVEPAFPVPAFSSSTDSGCQSLEVRFKNESRNANQFTWYFGDGDLSNEANPVHIYRQSGVFDVKLIARGPGGEVSVFMKRRVVVFEKPYAAFMAGPTVSYLPRAYVQTKNNSAGAETYQWMLFGKVGAFAESNDFEPRFHLNDTGYYKMMLIAMNDRGCRDTAELNNAVYVNPKGFIYIPDAYTPNKDDLNDVFKPVSLNLLDDGYTFSIYSRWGELLFNTHDKNAGWDGQYSGRLCQSGVYVYKVNGRLLTAEDVALEGVVHLMR
jgi:gliding motility-associated-like protein